VPLPWNDPAGYLHERICVAKHFLDGRDQIPGVGRSSETLDTFAPPLIDAAWHRRIQYPVNYARFCRLARNVTKAFQLGGELNYRKTSWLELRSNDGISFQAQAEWKF
jgi:hypothetical protein